MRVSAAVLTLLALATCDSGSEERGDVSSTRVVQRPFDPAPAGSVPRGAAERAAALAPPGPAVTPALIERGRERFRIYCSPCHGVTGGGDGPVVSRGFPAPPSYFEDRLREAPAEHIVQVITNGLGRMSPYADRVTPEDRWAIAHYVKELQARDTQGSGAVQ